ncbi:FAD binding domain-containing protein [Pyricularia oryzae]|nr:FAD binding domain-containing protein [Pyricularia oryzae]
MLRGLEACFRRASTDASCSESSCNVPFIRGFADVDAAIERLRMRGRSGSRAFYPDLTGYKALGSKTLIGSALTQKPVIIVGAGPSGLLLALLLSQRGIPVRIVEAEAQLDDQPRAAHYGSAALPDLDRAGVLAEVKKRGIIITDFAFRYAVPAGSPEDKDGSGFAHIATLDTSCVSDVDGFDYRSHCLVLQDLDALMLEMLIDRLGDDVVSWRHRVLDVGQDEERKVAWVDVATPEGRKRVEGDYVVGCDGAASQVRRSLFGQDYPGFTWEKQIVATNTYYDFTKFGWGDVSMVIHPDNFFASHHRMDPWGVNITTALNQSIS